MSQQTEGNFKAFQAGSALASFRRVKLNSSIQAVYAGAGEDNCGITQQDVNSGDNVTVALESPGRTFKPVDPLPAWYSGVPSARPSLPRSDFNHFPQPCKQESLPLTIGGKGVAKKVRRVAIKRRWRPGADVLPARDDRAPTANRLRPANQ